ncbi:MAG: biopolymer transporter ExbD [Bacteriovorax sp.]|jgi:biopolymer transport protein ExbD|nr:biopolymer transporter ExbD [Bacteriovorax sp.]
MAMGNMNQNSGDDENIMSEINMTPLIDIMLVLLIIFMVTSTAALESGLDIELPKTQITNEKKQDEILIITLDKDGKVAIAGKTIAEADLGASIASSLKSLKTESVILEGDTKAFLGKAVQLMDLAKNAGAKNFSIAAEEDPNKIKK